jgi:hypothetical protein
MISDDLEFELFLKIKRIPYVKVIEKYIKEYNEDKLMIMSMQYLSDMPENIQMDIVKTLEENLLSSFALFASNKDHADCENVLILILKISGMHDLLDNYDKNNLDKEQELFLMKLFRFFSFSYAHFASHNKEIRKLLGIRKGTFFR